MMKLTVNGEQIDSRAGKLEELLKELSLDERPCATLVNGNLVRRTKRGEWTLNEGDSVDIISMVGGG